MKYPGLPRELDRRRVLTESEISEMRTLRESGFGSRKIGEMYAISKTTVLYWTNDDSYRDKVNNKRYQLIKAREKGDINYKTLRAEQKRENVKSLVKRSDAIKKFKGKQTYKWKKNKLNSDNKFRDKTNQQALSAYHRKKLNSQRQ